MVTAVCVSNLRQAYLSFHYEMPILTMGDLYYVDEVEKDQNGIPLGKYAVHKSHIKQKQAKNGKTVGITVNICNSTNLIHQFFQTIDKNFLNGSH